MDLANTSPRRSVRPGTLNLQAMQLTALPILFLMLHGFLNTSAHTSQYASKGTALVIVLWGSAAILRRVALRLSVGLFVVSTAAVCASIVWGLWSRPAIAILLLALFLLHCWFVLDLRPLSMNWRHYLSLSVRDGSFLCIGFWFVLSTLNILDDRAWLRGLLMSNAILAINVWALLVFDRRFNVVRLRLFGLMTLALLVWMIYRLYAPGYAVYWATFLFPLFGYFTHMIRRDEPSSIFVENVLRRPELVILAVFLGLSIGGTALLILPESSAAHPISALDAAFTAVSAVCVTGLIVLDTPVDFSFMGQLVILLLIQFGGLGIMALSAVATFLLGRRLSLRQEGMIAGVAAYQHRPEIRILLRDILLVTFALEGLGIVLLWAAFFWAGEAFWQALWRATFTAVSAFCNAGFALQSESLMPYQSNLLVLSTVSFLIILGGMSPGYILAVFRLPRSPRTSLQLKAASLMTLMLLALGFLGMLSLEWSNTLGGFSVKDKLFNAWFQSVTTRTAGFNSVDFAFLKPATLYLMMALMFIGGSPGGTAGGIKTTTFFVLLAAIIGAFRGEGQVHAFGRRVSTGNVFKAAAVATASLLIAFLTLMGISLTQDMAPLTAIFETVSALGTVGLSLGGTARLDGVGKVMIMFCMFAGRIGPITVFLLLGRPDKKRLWNLPEEEIVVT